MPRLRRWVFLTLLAQTLGWSSGMVLCVEPARGEARMEFLVNSCCPDPAPAAASVDEAVESGDCGGCCDVPLLAPLASSKRYESPPLFECEGPPGNEADENRPGGGPVEGSVRRPTPIPESMAPVIPEAVGLSSVRLQV